jgi:hypothetical protein
MVYGVLNSIYNQESFNLQMKNQINFFIPFLQNSNKIINPVDLSCLQKN